VGFPGETDEDFGKTIELTERARYDGQFSFVYSARPKTQALLKEDEWGVVPHEVKVERLERLQAVQKRISQELNALNVGRTVEVLVEGRSKTDETRRFGRTPQNRTVNFDGDAPAGAIVEVHVERASASSLGGKQGRTLSAPLVAVPEARVELEACVA
jgi:tRNA-2-methylthio-N6-dimethylallyladenosine synthase